jgi:predicted membrane channel-forming protein YqfA (hemolysin III family)
MSFFKKLTAVKPTDIEAADKKRYQILCLVGAGIAVVTMILMLICLVGFGPVYTWSSLAFGVLLGAFFGLAYLRYMMPHNKLVARFSDAAVYLTLVGAYTPITLLMTRLDVYENGSIVAGWVIFGVVAFFSLLFLIAALCSTHKFRLLGSFFYILMAAGLSFAIPALQNAFLFAPVLGIILPILCMLAFAASPIIFWFFDSKKWQMTVYYSLMVGGTAISALMVILYTLIGR